MVINISTRFTIYLGGKRQIDISSEQIESLTNDLNKLYDTPTIDTLQKKNTQFLTLNVSVSMNIGDSKYTFEYDELKPLYKQLCNMKPKNNKDKYVKRYSAELLDRAYKCITDSLLDVDAETVVNKLSIGRSTANALLNNLIDRNLVRRFKIKGKGKRWYYRTVKHTRPEKTVPSEIVLDQTFDSLKRDKEQRRDLLRNQ